MWPGIKYKLGLQPGEKQSIAAIGIGFPSNAIFTASLILLFFVASFS